MKEIVAFILLGAGVAPAQQASACAETRYPIVEKGTSLSRIARKIYEGREKLWPLIAKRNNLSAPYTIYYLGKPLVIPCVPASSASAAKPRNRVMARQSSVIGEVLRASVKRKSAFQPATVRVRSDEPQLLPMPPATSVQTAFVQPNVNALGMMPTATIPAEIAQIPTVSESASLAQGVKADSETITPRPIALLPARKPVRNELMRPGTYSFQLDPSQVRDLRPGEFPALTVGGQGKNGLWNERTKNVATVRKTDDGKFFAFVRFSVAPNAHSAAIIDLGDGNLVQIAGNVIAEEGMFLPQAKPTAKIKSRRYETLTTTFVKKPSIALSILRHTATIAVPVGAGFALGGPVGAGLGTIPIAKSFVMGKIEKLKATARAENPPPHVQYVLANQEAKALSQDAKINQLQLQMEEMQKQMKVLLATKKGERQ